MELHVVEEPSFLEELFIIPISDCHIGDPGFNEKEVKKTLEKGAQIGALFLLNGDLVNNAVKSSISACYEEVIPPGDPQIDYAVELLRPYRELIVGIVSGNHERRTTREVNVNPAYRIAKELGVRYFGDEAFIKVRFGEKKNRKPVTYTIYATHGWGGGRTVGGKVNSMAQCGKVVVSDIYLTAHTHQITAFNASIFVPDQHNGNVIQMEQWFVSSGGYLERQGYPICKGYPPLRIGSPVIRLGGREKDIEVTL